MSERERDSFRDPDELLDVILKQLNGNPGHVARVLDQYEWPLIAFSPEHVIIYANETAEKFFGYPRGVLEDRKTWALIPERFRTYTLQPVTSQHKTIVVASIRADLSEMDTEWTFAAVTKTKKPFFVTIARDVKLMREQVLDLQQTQRRYFSLLNDAEACVLWYSDADGKNMEVQPAWEAYTGQTREEYSGWDWVNAIHPDDRAHLMHDWLNAVQNHRPSYNSHGRIWSAKHQAWRAFQTRGVPVRDREGKVIEWVGVLTDIQDAVDAAQARVAESEHRYTVLFEQSPVPLALTRASDGRFVAANQAYADLFEMGEPDNIVGKSLIELGFATAAQRADMLDALVKDGHVVNREYDARTAMGKPITVAISVSRVKIEGNEVFLTTAMDITERKRSEAQLAEAVVHEKLARAEAERANRAKDEFLAVVSHELRTPLTAIEGWAKLLRHGEVEGPMLGRGIEVVERNAQTLGRLINDLLDMSRIIAGKLKLHPGRVLVTDLIAQSVEVIRPAADNKGVRLELRIEPQLPLLIADASRLQQVLWNLLTNAIRYTDRGGRVTITVDQAADNVRIIVEDTGLGIPPEHLPLVFERFRQVDSSATRGGAGLGLGLAIVRYIVEAHGGAVEAHSSGLGEGSKFTVSIPVPAVEMREQEIGLVDVYDPATAELQVLFASKPLHEVRVLVVEDQKDSLELICTVLRTAGASVTGASSAVEALKLAGPFDVMVSDICMPHVDGYEMIQHIRTQGGEKAMVPALALTALAGAGFSNRAELAGFDRHVAKPVDPAQLVVAVERLSRGRRPSEKLSS